MHPSPLVDITVHRHPASLADQVAFGLTETSHFRRSPLSSASRRSRSGGVERPPVASIGQEAARREFVQSLRWIVLASVAMVAGSLYYISLFSELTVAAVLLTTTAVFLSMALGCGLFALAFFSDKSGHDDEVTGATGAQPTVLPLHDADKR